MAFLNLPLLIFMFYIQFLAGSSCPDNWIDCGNGKCIAHLWRCDGDNDCGNLKDEENCESGIPPKACLSHQFQCVANGHCIPKSWHCDGEHDCEDNSDEIGCDNDTQCSGFRCKDHHCIPEGWRCDGRKDCPDESDEEGCPKAEAICSPTEFLCSSGTCLDRQRVCDGKKDCSDASDEGKHCSDLCGNSTCSQKCRPTPSGPECFCNDGFKLHRDNRTCLDIDECSNEGFCSQQCTNLMGNYSCSCMDGYDLINNTCRASGPEPLLVFSTVQEIRGMYLRTKRYFLIKKAVLKAAAVDVDPLESRVYWVEISNRSSVYSSKLDGNGFQVILENGLMVPEDIAVDYVARNLYFTDSGLKQILACKMDGSMCHVLHTTNVQKPRAIAVDPPEGFLYWSDWGNDTAGIYRSGMDGSRRITLVSKDVKWPNGIAIDHTTNRLYWTDANLQTIEYITLDGKTRKVLMMDQVFHPYSLAVFEDNLYWSDWHTFSLDTCDKFTTHKMNVLTKENGKHIMGVHVYHPVLARKASNPCWSSSCSHMCLVAPLDGYSCVCPLGFTLSNNKRTCIINDNFPMLLVNDESSIYHIRPEAVGNNVVAELPLTHYGTIGKLAYDWGTKTLFMSDMRQPAIYTINMTNLVTRELVKNHLVAPEDLAFDSLSGNLYWVDSSKGTVEVVSIKNSETATLIVDLSKPMAIALVPTIGKMFISTVGENPSISMYDMNGHNERKLDSTSGSAVALAVHPSGSLLYWADLKAETISSIDYMNSRSHSKIIKHNMGSVMSLAVNDKYIYWTDTKHHVVSYIVHNSTHTHTIHLPGLKSGIAARRVLYAASPTFRTSRGEMGCQTKNGGCSHLCLSSLGGRSCACPIGMVLSKDGVTCTEKDCTPNEFRCVSTKKCIPKEFVCDGLKDCDDGSDEVCDGTPNRCPGNDFRCSNGRCIYSKWKCDRRDDCGDNSDEEGCAVPTSCAKDQFTCGGGECIAKLWRCDGEADCVDASDESECHATTCDPETQIRCDHGQCIPASWACDGAPDCFDNTDETNCTKVKTCSARDFQCESNSECVDKILVCDGRKDCEDGSDEKNCSQSTLKCPKEGHHLCKDGKTCLYIHEVCDGYKDCEHGDDEVNCTRAAVQCTSEEYFCTNNSRCISRRWICDGDNDCGDAADEIPENCTGRAKPTLPPHKSILECEEFACRLSGECIPWSSVCDGVKDCGDLTDEGRLCATACQGDNGGCAHKCQKTPDGTRCSCYNGYALSNDDRTCEDINECEMPGSCSHFCNNTKGGFKCSCAEGFFLEHDHKRCKADGGAASFVYLLPDQIRGIDLGTRSTRVYVKDDGADMRGMDYDAEEGLFFWSDWKEGTINSYIPNTNKQDVILTTSVRPHYLRWNWIAKNIYYTDDEGSIVSCSRDGKYCTTAIQNIATHINSFDISPTKGLMFWSLWELVLHRGSGVIERAEMDGSHRVVIVSDRIIWPTAVTVDHILNMLYWTDANLNVMECSDFHGLKRRTVVAQDMSYPFSMTLFEDYVYWSDWGTDSFIRCDKFDSQNCRSFHRNNVKAEVLMVVHKVKQPKGVNHCDHNRCPQLCLPTRSSYTCKCDNLYILRNSTCVLKPTASPLSTIAPSCPKDYCFGGAKCIVGRSGTYYCVCSEHYKGEKCEVKMSATEDVYDYTWVVGLVLSILFVITIVMLTILCRRNRDKLSKVKENVAVSFRNTTWARKSGPLVMDTDDVDGCDELMLGKRGSFKQPGSFGNPLFGKKPRIHPDAESQDGEFKRWPSYDSNDSAFVSESQTREGSQLCIDEVPLRTPNNPADRLVQFFRR